MHWKTRVRFAVEKILAPPAIIIMVLMGFRPMGRGSRRT